MKEENKILEFLAHFLIVLGIVIVFASILNFPKQEFTITKEVCEEKEFDIEIGRVDASLVVMGLEEVSNITSGEIIECPTNTNICRIYRIENRTSCHEEEVEWVILNNVSDAQILDCWILDDGSKCLFNMRINQLLISEKYLTTGWLDVDAECNEWTYKKINQDKDGRYEVTKDKCLKYKLGIYTIEVNGKN